jgi:ABC-type transporter Mla maintaining outer membrane lipid asymmetry permease subunit MlaE
MQAKQVRGSLVENVLAWFTTTIGRVVVALIVPLITFVVLWQGYIFLRDTNAPKLVVALIAIIWGGRRSFAVLCHQFSSGKAAKGMDASFTTVHLYRARLGNSGLVPFHPDLAHIVS